MRGAGFARAQASERRVYADPAICRECEISLGPHQNVKMKTLMESELHAVVFQDFT